MVQLIAMTSDLLDTDHKWKEVFVQCMFVIALFLTVVFVTSCAYSEKSTQPATTPESDILASAKSRLLRHDFETAIADYNEAIASEPSNARAYLGRGWAKWLHGDDDSARKDINEALRLDPGLGNAYNLRAFIRLNEGDYAGADADYTKAMDLDPTLKTADTYTNRGLARLRKEDTRAAEEDCNRALKINPEYARALLLRIAARMMTTRTKVARGDFTSLVFPGEFVQMLMLTGGLGECHGIELNNKYTGRYLQLGLEYCNNNELDKAIVLFTKAIELNPDLPEAYNNRGYVYAKRNWNERAMKDYRKALNIDPDFSPTRRNVAELLKQLNSQQDFIKKKQAQLSQLGYYEGEVDGVATPAHTEAIKRFQKAHGLGATGDLDYETYEVLERAYESSASREKADKRSPETSPSQRDDVREDEDEFKGKTLAEVGKLLYGKSRSWAALIGINDYSNKQGFASLPYAVNDAVALKDVLIKDLGFAENHVFLLKNPTRKSIDKLLAYELPKKVARDDRVVIFFSGHGGTKDTITGKMGFLVPVDGNIEDLYSTSISMTQIGDYADIIPAKQILFIIDACYSGLVGSVYKGGNLEKGVRKQVEAFMKNNGRQVMTAGTSEEKAAMSKKWNEHSVYTYYLLEGLKGEADSNGDGVVTVHELQVYLESMIPNEANQTPQLRYLRGWEGQFVFYKEGAF
jgi:Tfp pilus assembly protein PilF